MPEPNRFQPAAQWMRGHKTRFPCLSSWLARGTGFAAGLGTAGRGPGAVLHTAQADVIGAGASGSRIARIFGAMPSERIQRRIDTLLDEADAAVTSADWLVVAEKARAALSLDSENADGRTFLSAAQQHLGTTDAPAGSPPESKPVPVLPSSFVAGRYAVRRFLGEGGRKRVYLAHDSRLDREVAFCVIRAEGLDLVGHQRVLREAQSVARLGQHPNLVTVHDIGEDAGNPYIVQEFMAGGDVSGLIEQAEEHRLPIERTLAIAKDVCKGLSFIHAGGMVHRDLKPANVFLSSDGTAKIGDFGLAVALDRSRITQYGLMLGTVSYMPPEQALGGESTPKADLYSLGAMLYELVTGRPPFLGDDPTAVISQHINTPPVAPSWVTEHCPPSLEEVILGLLEKDPGQRPANAAEVLAALEKVDPSQKSASHSDSNVLDRLARGVFVGREKELERLRNAFDEAFAGHGGLVMLVGEPGIGKTRTTQELETYARMRGATVLWGRTHESSGVPPYWPWVQVGNQWVASGEIVADLRLPPDAVGQLSRIFPVLRQESNFVEPQPESDPAVAQFRLFDAYAEFLRAVTASAPLVIALDDLHWADQPTLQLLEHVGRELARSRILIVGNYRDTDITRQSALGETLAALNREAGFERIVLRGLSREEVDSYIRAKANTEPKREVLDRIYEETEGNAFFLSEVVNLMAQEGTLNKDSVSDIAIPDGVREAIGRRLNRLSKETNDLLQLATILGREFSYDALAAMGERSEDQLLQLLEEALDARVIEELERPGRYRFTHAQIQETLLAELSTTRRVRLHGQVGEALERRWGARAEERATELARHFVEAATLSQGFASKASRYAALAAEHAEQQSAWYEAARWYEAAIATDDDPDAAILTALAYCYASAFVYVDPRALQTLIQALDKYRARGDARAFARAVASMPFAVGQLGAQYYAIFQEAIALAGDSGADINVTLRRKLLLFLRMGGGWNQEEWAQIEAELVELLSTHEEVPERSALTLVLAGYAAERAGQFSESARALFEASQAYVELGRGNAAVDYLWIASNNASLGGDLVQTRRYLRALRVLSEERHDANGLTFFALFTASVALLNWDVEEFQTIVTEGGLVKPGNWYQELRGQPDAARADAKSAILNPGGPGVGIHEHGGRAGVFWRAGDVENAAVHFNAWSAIWREGGGGTYQRAQAFAMVSDCLRGGMGDDELAEKVYREVRPWKNCTAPWGGIGLDAPRGWLALRLGHIEEARESFEEGLAWAEREGCPIECGRNLQGLADLAELRGDTAEAVSLLNRAAAYYQPRGVKLFLDEVVKAKVRLQGLTSEDMGSSIVILNRAMQAEQPDLRPAASPEGIVTLLFSDIENSTPHNEQMGDTIWMELLRAHNLLIEREVAAAGGSVVKTMGDGFMVAFSSARAALGCAISAQRALGASKQLQGIRVRMGLHTGEMIREGDDFFGRHVTLAARIASSALGGQIVVSDVVHELVSGGDFVFSDQGEVAMKGFVEPVRVWQLEWDGPVGAKRDVKELRIDIDRERQARRVAEVVESEYFRTLRSQTNDLRRTVDKS
jgi:class 3 adenylate cyclase